MTVHMPLTGELPYPRALDHLFVLVDNLNRACQSWRKMGFLPTAKGYHNKQLGTANYVFVFTDTYLELLGIEQATERNQAYRQYLRYGETLRGLAFKPWTDLEDCQTSRRAAALPASKPIAYSRPVPEFGTNAIARFRSIMDLTNPVSTGVTAFVCQHETPQYIWRPDVPEHANGSTGIATVWIGTRDFEKTEQAYMAICDSNRVSRLAEYSRFSYGRTDLRILQNTETSPFLPSWLNINRLAYPVPVAVEMFVSRLSDTQCYFEQAGFETLCIGPVLWVRNHALASLAIGFRQS